MTDSELGTMRWAPRVARREILRLYEMVAKGILDEGLIDDVAYAFYARCESIAEVSEAASGRVKCPECGTVIVRAGGKEEILDCAGCSWRISWRAYRRSYQGKQLMGGGALHVFQEFLGRLPAAKTPKEKMLLVDRLIHECHKDILSTEKEPLYTRPVACNLIEGKMTQLIGFLEGLPYGPGSAPGMEDALVAWRKNVLSGVKKRSRQRDEGAAGKKGT